MPSIANHPIYPVLLPVPITCFTGAVMTDLAYRSTAQMLWQNFSIWLITAGLVAGLLAAVVLLINFVRTRERRSTAGRLHVLFFLVALAVELINALVHSRDGWTAVIPTGLALSIAGAALILVSGWLWQSARAARDTGS